MESSPHHAQTEEADPKGLLPIIIIPTDEAWVVVLVTFCQNFLHQSIPLTMLLLATDTQTGSFVTADDKYRNAAIFFGLSFIFTPISCSLLNWYSFRVFSIIGPVVIVLAMISTYFTEEYHIISFFTFCVIGGFGSSMINATSICLPTVWFCNKRDMACHISTFGQSLGILIIPWFTKEIFIESFNFSIADTYFLYAGIYLPLIALGLAIPKLYGINIQVESSKKVRSKVTFRDEEAATHFAQSMSILGHNSLSYSLFKTYHNLMFPRVKDIIKERSVYILVPELVMARCVDPPYRKDKPTKHKEPYSKNKSEVSFSFYGVQDVHLFLSPLLPGYGCRPFYRIDIFFSAGVTELNIYYRQVNQLDYHMAVSRAVSKKDYQQEIDHPFSLFPEAISRAFLSMFHFSLWKHLYFICLQVAFALFYFGHYVPFIFINDRGLEFDHEEQSFTIVNYIGFGHITGPLLAFFFSFFWFDPDNIFILIFLLSIEGCFSVISNYFEDFQVQVAYGIFTGFYMSVSELVMVPSILRITGLSNLTNAMGYVLIFQGIGIITGTLVCVGVKKNWETVKYCYHLSGLCMLVTAILLAPLKKLKQLSREEDTDLV